MRKILISTHTPSEKRVGYSRAVIVGEEIYTSGTTATNEVGETVGRTLKTQTEYILKKIIGVLQQGGFTLNDVIIVRVYLTKLNKLAEFDAVFKQYFVDIKPACTLVGVHKLVKPDLFVEIECVAKK